MKFQCAKLAKKIEPRRYLLSAFDLLFTLQAIMREFEYFDSFFSGATSRPCSMTAAVSLLRHICSALKVELV